MNKKSHRYENLSYFVLLQFSLNVQYHYKGKMNRNSCKYHFKLICIVVVIFMIGYWFYKYEIEDRDIGVVDYMSLEDAKDVDFPLATLCIKNPFLVDKLNQTVPGTTQTKYLKYLNGEYWKDAYKTINYQSITIDLNDYFTYAQEKRKTDSNWRNSSLLFYHREVFNGFYQSYFIKCFSIESDIRNHRDIKKIRLYYSIQGLVEKLQGLKVTILYKINYPGQFLLGEDPYLFSMQAGYSRFVRIKKIEILRRRNTMKKKCSESSLPYDIMIMKKHAITTGCRPPYLKIETSSPDCKTIKGIKKSRFEYEMAAMIDYPKDCLRMSEIRRSATKSNKIKKLSMSMQWRFGMSYPEEVKRITQSKEIDVHTLIGNIGGYFGLFLGKFFCKHILTILHVADAISNKNHMFFK